MPELVEFRVLGRLEVRVNGRPVEVTAHREKATLAALLFHPDEIVTTSRLVDAVWDQDLPANPANQIAICVLALRRKLAAAGVTREVILTRAPGYLVQVTPGQLDTRQVLALVARARAAQEVGRLDAAVSHLRTALGLWRGPVLPGLRNGWLAPELVRWEELRVALFEQCVQLELDLGRPHKVIGELTAMVADQGLRERPREQLMIALYRAGRPAQALSVYRVTRKMFLEELGIEPSAHLRRVHDAILAGTLSKTPGFVAVSDRVDGG